MCAILDANVAWQVFGPQRPPAGRTFFERIDFGRIRHTVSRQTKSVREPLPPGPPSQGS